MSKVKIIKPRSCKKGYHQKQTGGHGFLHKYAGTGPRGERPSSLSATKKKK